MATKSVKPAAAAVVCARRPQLGHARTGRTFACSRATSTPNRRLTCTCDPGPPAGLAQEEALWFIRRQLAQAIQHLKASRDVEGQRALGHVQWAYNRLRALLIRPS